MQRRVDQLESKLWDWTKDQKVPRPQGWGKKTPTELVILASCSRHRKDLNQRGQRTTYKMDSDEVLARTQA